MTRALREAGYPTMTTLALRYRKGYFVVSGPDTQPTRFRSRREVKDWCHPWRNVLSHRRPQLRRAADVAAFVKRHANLKPLAAHRRRPVGVERLEQRERGAAGFSRP